MAGAGRRQGCPLGSLGAIVVIVTHDPRMAEWRDRIVELADGRIVSDRKR